VDYYNAQHKRELEKYPSAGQIQGIAGRTISVPAREFFSNAMFHRVRHESVRARNAETQRRQIVYGYDSLRPWISLQSDSIHLADGLTSVPNEIPEHIGESIALSIANRIYQLQESDWLPIGVGNRKPSFDVQSASDGSRIVELEMKGSAVEDPSMKSRSISDHKVRIDDKKAKIAVEEHIERIGAIVAFPKRIGKIRCWLLDPEAGANYRDPLHLRILSRLHFIRWAIWLVSPRSPLALALANRIVAIESITGPFQLTNVPLIDANGEPFGLRYPFRSGADIPQFFLSRSHVVDGPAGGVVEPIDHESLLFVGFREELLVQAIEQDFEKMLAYTAIDAVIRKTVRCVVRNEVLRRFGIDPNAVRGSEVGERESRFDLSGTLAYTKEGLVFGELAIDDR
jgi:hypothetical protein